MPWPFVTHQAPSVAHTEADEMTSPNCAYTPPEPLPEVVTVQEVPPVPVMSILVLRLNHAIDREVIDRSWMNEGLDIRKDSAERWQRKVARALDRC